MSSQNPTTSPTVYFRITHSSLPKCESSLSIFYYMVMNNRRQYNSIYLKKDTVGCITTFVKANKIKVPCILVAKKISKA